MDLKDVIVVPLYISGGIKDFSIIDLKNLLLCIYINCCLYYFLRGLYCVYDFIAIFLDVYINPRMPAIV